MISNQGKSLHQNSIYKMSWVFFWVQRRLSFSSSEDLVVAPQTKSGCTVWSSDDKWALIDWWCNDDEFSKLTCTETLYPVTWVIITTWDLFKAAVDYQDFYMSHRCSDALHGICWHRFHGCWICRRYHLHILPEISLHMQ